MNIWWLCDGLCSAQFTTIISSIARFESIYSVYVFISFGQLCIWGFYLIVTFHWLMMHLVTFQLHANNKLIVILNSKLFMGCKPKSCDSFSKPQRSMANTSIYYSQNNTSYRMLLCNFNSIDIEIILCFGPNNAFRKS